MPSKKTTPKKKAKAKTSHYPVVLGTDLFDDGTPQSQNKLLQVDRELSKQNHRLYRMCRYYNLSIDVIPTTTDNQVDIYVLADTWALQKSVQMAYAQYLENTKEERAKLRGPTARWSDFRVAHGLDLTPGGVPDTLLSARYSRVGAPTEFVAGEFELTKVVDSAGVTRTFTLGAGTGTQYSIISEYDVSGNQQATPDSTVTGAYQTLDDESDQANVEAIQNDGNAPPYNQTTLAPNQMWVRVATLGAGAAGQQKLSSGNFVAPMGLVLIRGVSSSNTLKFSVKRGDYKGVHAPSMME